MIAAGAFTTVLLETVNLAMKKFPEYDQRKQEEFSKLRMEFQSEITKAYPYRDDDLVLNLRDQLLLHVKAFSGEISGKKGTG